MILLKELKLKRFRNISGIALEDLRDLNILIGPNNCGKTNILEFLNRFADLRTHRTYDFLCEDCSRFKNKTDRLLGVLVGLTPDDHYGKLRPTDGEVEASLLFDKDVANKLLLGRVDRYWDSQTVGCQKVEDRITLSNLGTNLLAIHLSPFLHPDILENIRPVLYCSEGRLQTYKGKSFPDFINTKQLTGAQRTQLVNLVARLVDPRIKDYKGNDLIREFNDHDLTVTIAEQGSGVRSLICMAADILSDQKSKIVLIDEPELGLNPFARQELLRFLLDLTKDRQIFVATQDPAFVNPVLWGSDPSRISVYLFSLQTDSFVKVDLSQDKEDPETFAGYLPHTTSLKNVHIYVEGTSDVYIFQVFLRKFLGQVERYNAEAVEETSPGTGVLIKHARLDLGDRFEIENKIGIFHLNGSNWRHLLYTVPKAPYRCILILDGNMKEEVPSVIKNHNKAKEEFNASEFRFASSVEEVRNTFLQGSCHPIYCLQESSVEDYLFTNGVPSNHDKKRDGPRAAEGLEKLPEEIYQLLLTIVEPDFLTTIRFPW